MASHVDQSTYEKIKTDIGAEGVIYGIPVGANYGNFKENIQSYTTGQSSSYSEEQFRNVSWTGLSPEAADAYKECIRLQKKGLFLIPDKATDTDITFRVSYTIVGGSANPVPVAWTGGAVAENSLPKTISAGEHIIVESWPGLSEQLRLIDKWTPAGFALSV